jgi:putative GTP pyrophosphokinase
MHILTDLFKKQQKSYEDFKVKLESLITELLIHGNINYHKLECRVKEVDKLDEKIIRKNEKYQSLDDITDLIGIRIITYFEDEVDKVAELINSEFTLDKENSIDKRKSESDRFGYKSLHYVVTLSNERKILTE